MSTRPASGPTDTVVLSLPLVVRRETVGPFRLIGPPLVSKSGTRGGDCGVSPNDPRGPETVWNLACRNVQWVTTLYLCDEFLLLTRRPVETTLTFRQGGTLLPKWTVLVTRFCRTVTGVSVVQSQ